ncbi:hypothetical protein H5410_004754 [Solanum commersonii]|uniref:Uncharacterized protein n=1 Tax=Solanum commersonii TaxID=4109 RepID=A0A9J6A581_SOLCO|nr:hypothetical protein H5410_004754 [Solanum commersonii]
MSTNFDQSLELDEETYDKVYGLLYTSGSKDDYYSEYGSNIELLDASDNDKNCVNPCTTCKDSSFDDLKNEVENLKREIKSLKQNQLICDHRITKIEINNSEDRFSKNKGILENHIEKGPNNLYPKRDMFMGIMQIITTHKWYAKCTILIDNSFSITNIAMIDSSADVSCIQEGFTFSAFQKFIKEDNSSFDDVKNEVENLKREIKSLKQNQLICDHRITQIEINNFEDMFSKNKGISENYVEKEPINLDPKKNMFLGMMQIISGIDVSCIQEGLMRTKYFQKTTHMVKSASGHALDIKYKLPNTKIS